MPSKYPDYHAKDGVEGLRGALRTAALGGRGFRGLTAVKRGLIQDGQVVPSKAGREKYAEGEMRPPIVKVKARIKRGVLVKGKDGQKVMVRVKTWDGSGLVNSKGEKCYFMPSGRMGRMPKPSDAVNPFRAVRSALSGLGLGWSAIKELEKAEGLQGLKAKHTQMVKAREGAAESWKALEGVK